MAVTPPRTSSVGPLDADLIIIGGGPAGCAAARMAASVGMGSVLIEREALCRNLYRVPALGNVLGGYTSGPELADAIAAELMSTERCRLELGRHATEVRAHDDHVTVTMDGGIRLTAPAWLAAAVEGTALGERLVS
uniref:FAD-dependent oxidoreductase n=1 Tax=Streptomyces TaxID=1883 RepID=UPI002B057919